MSLYFSKVNDDEIRKYYEFSLDKDNAYHITTHLRALFIKRLSELNVLEKFKEFKAKFQNFKGTNESKNEYKKLYNELTLEYDNIMNKSYEFWMFDGDLIQSLEFKSDSIYSKTGKNGLNNINKEILNKEVDLYIKFDKDLIIIKNKINDLINLISF